VLYCRKVSGVGVKEAAAKFARSMTGERPEETATTVTETSGIMLRRWRCLVNRPSTGLGSRIAGTAATMLLV
jgi:hypothetical protein